MQSATLTAPQHVDQCGQSDSEVHFTITMCHRWKASLQLQRKTTVYLWPPNHNTGHKNCRFLNLHKTDDQNTDFVQAYSHDEIEIFMAFILRMILHVIDSRMLLAALSNASWLMHVPGERNFVMYWLSLVSPSSQFIR